MRNGRQVRRTGLKPGYAFGLELSACVPIPVAAANGRGSGRATTWELVTDVELASTWNAKEAVSLLDRRHLSGRPMLAIDHHEALGYRLAAPGFGRHIVSGDGQTVRSVLPNVAPWRWQRLLFAQVLPLAANLQGLEVLHASAVELDGHAHAFVAPAGTGKTSVAATSSRAARPSSPTTPSPSRRPMPQRWCIPARASRASIAASFVR